MVTVWGKLASSSLKAQRLAATGLSQHWALSRPDLLAIFYTLDPPPCTERNTEAKGRLLGSLVYICLRGAHRSFGSILGNKRNNKNDFIHMPVRA